MPLPIQPVSIEGFPLGQVDRIRETDTPEGALRHINNADILDGGNISRRAGYTTVSGASGGHSLWSDPRFPHVLYVASTGQLVSIDRNGNRNNVVAISADLAMSYTWFDNRAYYTNGAQWGYVDAAGADHDWGITQPPAPAVSTTGTGSLSPGRYQFCITVTYNNGEESAPSAITEYELASTGSITLSLPNASGITHVNVYSSDLTSTGGTELYHYKSVTAGTTSIVINSQNPGWRLETHGNYADGARMDIGRMPAGTFVTTFKRMILSVVGSEIIWSDTRQVSIADLARNRRNFEEPITYVAPVEDGCYVGTANSTFWCGGNDPEDWTKTTIHDNGIIPARHTHYVPETSFALENLPAVGRFPYWWSTESELCIGRNGGFVQRITGSRLAVQEHQRFTGLYYESGGRRILINTLHNPMGSNTRKTPDTAVNNVYQYGLTLT